MGADRASVVLRDSSNGAAHYTAERQTNGGIEVIHLADAGHQAEVSIVPSIGNRAFAFKIKGKNVLYFPPSSLAEYQAQNAPGLNGIPFLAPWANRMAGGGFWAGGKQYRFNPDLGSVHLDANDIAIHGMLVSSSLWRVTELQADAHSAHVTSRLDFWKYPELMANWPFAHSYEMTYTLTNGALEVTTSVTNLGAQPMPVSIGFHPYLQIPDTSRSEETAHIPARSHVETDAHLVATGEFKSVDLADQISLRNHTFDDGFTDLKRDADGTATLSVQAGIKKVSVVYGPKYQVAVVYAPPGKDFICFEPMSAVTNGVNLAHDGKYTALQTVAPGGMWRESFWIRPSGF